MVQRRRPPPTTFTRSSSVIRLYLLRLLVPLGAYKPFVDRAWQFGGHDDTENTNKLLVIAGLPPGFEIEDDADKKCIFRLLSKVHGACEREAHDAHGPERLLTNIACVAKLVGLSEVDCKILEFAAILHSDRLLAWTSKFLGDLKSAEVFRILAVLLCMPEEIIRTALSSQGLLAKSGLLSVSKANSDMPGKLTLLSMDFADRLVSTEIDPSSLLQDMIVVSTPPTLRIDDFSHIDSWIRIVRPYLMHAMNSGRRGVNFLIYGFPGTGKTELVKVLANEFGFKLFEVSSEDSDGDPTDGEQRLRAFLAAQALLAKQGAVILFDEVEDVFNDGADIFAMQSTAQKHKAWINKILEDNPVPAFWLSNSVDCLDPAFVRRFDIVFELPVPPKKQRERIIAKACADIVGKATVARLSACNVLAPAIVTRAANVVRSIHAELDETSAVAALENLIGNTLAAQGHPPLKRNNNGLPELYDPAFINANCNLTEIAQGLASSKAGRLCLYGPPGTGKTAFGCWLADELGIPLITKRASDLFSKWVGENEKNIARAFHEAEKEGALLMLDEVDSFLQDRRGARANWEISQVNEMLTQIEAFSGIFIASTNLMHGLDQAALRRFDVKVAFDFLKPIQARDLFLRHCRHLSLPEPSSQALAQLASETQLTPGDFAAVIPQARFRRIASAQALLAALQAECALKEGRKAAIGFIQ